MTLQINRKYLNQEVEVLIDTIGDGWIEGNSREMKRVRVINNKYKLGELVNVKVYEPQRWLLIAK